LFFGVVAAVSLLADVSTKAWAEITLTRRNPMDPTIELIKDHLGFTLAYNPGGAWGLFQHHSEYVRRPFFLMVSLLAIAFIINLYGRLTVGQRALKWGLPLVLGGALGNLSDRIVRSNVIDFIDYQAQWIESMNRFVAKFQKGWAVTDHWPTFNVADIAICVGVGLMAVDMFTSRRGSSASLPPKPPAAPLPVVSPAEPAAGLSVPVAPDVTPPLKPDA
jgi:signal peptidase II